MGHDSLVPRFSLASSPPNLPPGHRPSDWIERLAESVPGKTVFVPPNFIPDWQGAGTRGKCAVSPIQSRWETSCNRRLGQHCADLGAGTGQPLTTPLRHDDAVETAESSQDGKLVVMASVDDTAKVWDTETGKALNEPPREDSSVVSAQFTSDGNRIVTACNNGRPGCGTQGAGSL